MKKLYIVANWKSNKTILQAEEWFRTINNLPVTFNEEEKKVIVCAPFTLLSKVKELTVNCKLSIVVGAQDVSPFDEGAYTGEVSASQVKEFADYVIIGHSERRSNFGETEKIVELKILQAIKFNLVPIICVSSINQVNDKWKMMNGKFIVAYEPVFAIGSGTPDTPENAGLMAKKIKEILGDTDILYGGSVTSNNVANFLETPDINGVLVGGASLDAQEFYKIIQNS